MEEGSNCSGTLNTWKTKAVLDAGASFLERSLREKWEGQTISEGDSTVRKKREKWGTCSQLQEDALAVQHPHCRPTHQHISDGVEQRRVGRASQRREDILVQKLLPIHSMPC